MTDPNETTSAEKAGQIELIHEIVNDLIVRRSAGETVTDESIIEQHPDLAPDLTVALRNLQMVERAEQAALWIREGLRLRCPHCQNPVEVIDDSSFSDVLCPSCGSKFSLTDDTDRTFQARREELVNHFQLLDRIGVGAFGSVWSARDTQLDRIVAIKIPRKGQLSNDDTEQFIREARAAAQLKHPNIVSVLEVGRYKDRIYIACDFIQGLDLADWLTDQQATPREAAELCATMADALQHAHNHGVIHRDLKPSNIMLDTAGEPHLMDFGLAKRESGEMTMTVEGKLLGTPAYMSPEQARGAAHDADARSDVYSLGVILFELLTGERPFRGSTRMLLHQVLVEDAPSPRKLDGQIPRDLETICLKCLEKSPDRRYPNAAELRDDLRRHLEDRPILARRTSRAEKLRRWRRRNPLVASLSLVLVAVLVFLAVAGPLVALRQSSLAKEKSSLAESMELGLYRSDVDSAYLAWANHDFDTARSLLQRHLRQAGGKDHREFAWKILSSRLDKLEDQPKLHHDGRVYGLKFVNDDTLVTSGGDGIKHWDVNRREVIRQIADDHRNSASSNLSVSSDGRFLATCYLGRNHTQIFQLSDGQCIRTIEGHSPIIAVFAPNDQMLALAGLGTLGLFDLTSSQWHPFELENKERVVTAEFSPDGKLLATCSQDRILRVWDVASKEVAYRQDVHNTTEMSILFSPSGRYLFHTGLSNLVAMVDLNENAVSKLFACQMPSGMAMSSDGKLLAVVGDNRSVRIWNRELGQIVDTLVGHTAAIWSVAFSPDGKTLATGSKNGNVRLWDGFATTASSEPSDYQAVETSLAICPQQRLLAIAWGVGGMQTGSGGMQFWDLDTLQPRDMPFNVGSVAQIFSLAFSPTDPIVVTGGGRRRQDGEVKLWSMKENNLAVDIGGYTRAVYAVAYSPDGATLAAAGQTNLRTVRLYDAHNGELQHEFEPLPKVDYGSLVPDIQSVQFSPSGRILAAGGGRFDGERGIVRLWDAESRTEIDTVDFDGGSVQDLAFFSDGDRMAISHAGMASLYNVSNRQKTLFVSSGTGATSLAISPDGMTLAVGTENKGVRLLHTESHGQLGVLSVPHRVTDLSFTPDGKSLIAACDNKSVWIWTTSPDESGANPVILNSSDAPSRLQPEIVGSKAWPLNSATSPSIDRASSSLEGGL